MNEQYRLVLFGGLQRPAWRRRLVALAVGLFVLSLGAHVVIAPTSEVVLIPFFALGLGMLVGVGVTMARGDMVSAWLVTLASLAGYFVYTAAIRDASGGLLQRLVALVRFDIVFYYGMAAVFFGTIAYLFGVVAAGLYRMLVS